MGEMNEGVMSGRLTADPILRQTKSAPPHNVCNFTLAQDHPSDYRKPRDQKRSCFFKFRVWGKTAEALCNNVVKGDRIAVGFYEVQEEFTPHGEKMRLLDIREARWISFLDLKKNHPEPLEGPFPYDPDNPY